MPPSIEAQNTVGSGDSMVAALAVAFAEGADFSEGLRMGTAAGAATVLRAGTHLCDRAGVERLLGEIVVRPLRFAAVPGG